MNVFLERAAFTVDLKHIDRAEGDPVLGVPGEALGVRGAAVRFSFAEPESVVEGKLLPGHQNYLIGNDRSRWRGGVPMHESVRYQGIAAGVSLDAYSTDGHFEYDVLAAAGVDLRQLTIVVEGAEGLALQADGSLAIATAVGPIVQSAPIAFVGEGMGRKIDCRCELRGERAFGFVARDWDGREDLRIDPGLTWSSYFGGSDKDATGGLVVGDQGFLTLGGSSTSLDFPVTPGAYRTAPVGEDLFVARLNPQFSAGSQLLVSTFFGGSDKDTCVDVAVDAQGIVTVLGTTRSTDLPLTPDAFQGSHGGNNDAYLVRFDLWQSGAQQLLYSTYVGGSGNDTPTGMVVEDGVVTLTGYSLSSNFPTTASAWSQTNLGALDVFLTCIDPGQPIASQLLYSTYFGSASGDTGMAITKDRLGRVVLAGSTSSATFPVTANAHDSVLSGPGDIFLAIFDLGQAPAQQLVYGTYLGGSGGDNATSVKVDSHQGINFCGLTNSSDFPVTANAFDTHYDNQEAYCARLDPALPPANQLVYATFVGGADAESATHLLVDAADVITFGGVTLSVDFPVTDGAFSSVYGGGYQDSYLVRIDPARPPAQQLLYSTLLGGDGMEAPFRLAADDLNQIWATGFTNSTDFATTPNGYDGTWNGGNDAFLLHLDMLPMGVTSVGTTSYGCDGGVAAGVSAMPRIGNDEFSFTCVGAPNPAIGVIVATVGAAMAAPGTTVGIDLWIGLQGAVTTFVSTVSGQGGVDVPFPIPAGAGFVGLPLSVQFVWYSAQTGPTCPMLGFSASNALDVVVQP
jgi:hypothetical protein